MAKVTVSDNYRVEVRPTRPGDFGWARISGMRWGKGEELAACEELLREIIRHVDGTGRRYISIECDTRDECEFCHSPWEFDPEKGLPACCQKAVDETEATATQREGQ